MREELIEAIHEKGLSHISEKLMQQSQASSRINTHAVVDEEEIELGASKIGGAPHLPKGMNWIAREGVPLTFIAQINMRDTMPYDQQKLLPQTGIIYFFYDSENQPWGFDPSDHNGWKVLYYHGDTSELMYTKPPSDQVVLYDTCALSFSSEITLPPSDSEYIRKLALTPLEDSLYYDLREEMEEELYKAEECLFSP